VASDHDGVRRVIESVVLMPIHIQPVTQAEQDIKVLFTLDDDHSLLADIVKAG